MINLFKNFTQGKNENQPKPKAKRFSPTVSFLIMGALVITAFFRGAVSNILFIILFAGCGLYKLAVYIKSKRRNDRFKPSLRKHRGCGHGKNDAV